MVAFVAEMIGAGFCLGLLADGIAGLWRLCFSIARSV